MAGHYSFLYSLLMTFTSVEMLQDPSEYTSGLRCYTPLPHWGATENESWTHSRDSWSQVSQDQNFVYAFKCMYNLYNFNMYNKAHL